MGNQQVQNQGGSKKRSISSQGGSSDQTLSKAGSTKYSQTGTMVDDIRNLKNGDKSPVLGGAGTLMTDGANANLTTQGGAGSTSHSKKSDISQALLNECYKDQRKINKIEVMNLLNEPTINLIHRTRFTKETAAHFCLKNGHKEILAQILRQAQEAVNQVDDDGNYPIHSLCFNSVSKFEDLKAMLVILKDSCGVNLSLKNALGKKPIDIIKQRIKEKNPYDTNLGEFIKLEPYLKEDCILLDKLSKSNSAAMLLKKKQMNYASDNDTNNPMSQFKC